MIQKREYSFEIQANSIRMLAPTLTLAGIRAIPLVCFGKMAINSKNPLSTKRQRDLPMGEGEEGRLWQHCRETNNGGF
jgi:hypothetical protein